VPKKDTSANVLSMLSTQGEQLRPAVTSRTTEVDEQPTAAVHELSPQQPADSGSGGRTRLRGSAKPEELQVEAEPPVENAPRTHRLDQRTANNLRAAWLAARLRGEVTISQQEYAGRIIALGLAAEARQLEGG